MLGADSDLQSYNLFAYCGNNPVNRADIQGELANWLIGGLTGALVSGVTALIKGENVGAAAAQGFISGAIAGAAVDVALAVVATGPLGIIGAGIIAYGGGYYGNMAGEDASSVLRTGHKVQDRDALKKRSRIAGGINLIAAGFSTVSKIADEGINSLNRCKDIIVKTSKALENLFNPSVSFTDGLSLFASVHFSIYNEGFCSLA